MVCRNCGYEDSENFSVCPYCGEKNSGQNQSMSTNQVNQYNQNNPSQYQTPFTRPNNPQNNQYNQNNNYYLNPTNNYTTIDQPINEPVIPQSVYDASEMAQYFKDGIGSVLDKQCTALMIIVPKKVSDSFEEKSKNFSTFKSHISTLGYDNKAYSDGKIDGKNMVQAKALNG